MRGAQGEPGAAGWLPLQRAADGPFVGAGKIGIPDHDILEPAIATRIGARHAQRSLLAERYVDRAIEIDAAVVAIASVDVAACLAELGIAADQVDRTAGGVLAIKRPLRSAQHFDTLDVVERDAEEREVALIDFVIIRRDRARLVEAEVRHRNAAQREDRGVVTHRRGQLEVGDLVDEAVDAGDARFGKGITGDGRNGDWHRLEVFRALGSGNDDLASVFCLCRSRPGCLRRLLCKGRLRCQDHGHRSSQRRAGKKDGPHDIPSLLINLPI